MYVSIQRCVYTDISTHTYVSTHLYVKYHKGFKNKSSDLMSSFTRLTQDFFFKIADVYLKTHHTPGHLGQCVKSSPEKLHST